MQDCCLLWDSRLVIPEAMRQRVLEELHAGHAGVSRMKVIARSLVWWSDINGEIEVKVQCFFQVPGESESYDCCANAPLGMARPTIDS